jgi:hypothetical protein
VFDVDLNIILGERKKSGLVSKQMIFWDYKKKKKVIDYENNNLLRGIWLVRSRLLFRFVSV